MTWQKRGLEVVAFVPVKQYVLAFDGTFGPEQIRKYVDAASVALEKFEPTPLERISTLAVDESGLARMTLGEDGGSGTSLPASSVLPMQYDVLASVKKFRETGVDVAAAGRNTVYRARDAAGAKNFVARTLKELRDNRPGFVAESVPGVPGGQCVTYTSRSVTTTDCVASAGRYVARFNDRQRLNAIQGLGASYLILKNAA